MILIAYVNRMFILCDLEWFVNHSTHIGPIFLQMIPIPARFRLKKCEPEPGSFLTGWTCQGSLLIGIIANSLLSCMRFRDWILIIYVFIMNIICALLSLKKKQKYRINTLWAWTGIGIGIICRNIGPLCVGLLWRYFKIVFIYLFTVCF